MHSIIRTEYICTLMHNDTKYVQRTVAPVCYKCLNLAYSMGMHINAKYNCITKYTGIVSVQHSACAELSVTSYSQPLRAGHEPGSPAWEAGTLTRRLSVSR